MRKTIGFALPQGKSEFLINMTPKGKELLNLIEPELRNSRLRDVVDFEVNYIRKSYEQDLSELKDIIDEMSHSIASKDAAIADKDVVIADKDEEIRILKEKLAKNGIK